MDVLANPRSHADLLGLLADEGAEGIDEGARDFVASALWVASTRGGWAEFPNALVALEKIQMEIMERAARVAGSELKLRGNTVELPLRALCAAIHKHGFGDSDGHEARRLIFCSLVELAAFGAEAVRIHHYQTLAAGLRVLIERQGRNPEGGVSSAHMSVWELFGWIAENPHYKAYVKDAWSGIKDELRKALWQGAVDTEDDENERDFDAGPQPYIVRDDETIWLVPEESRYQAALPDDLKQTLLTKALTRVTAFNRFSKASLLVVGSGEMQGFVEDLVKTARQPHQQAPHELAQLLSIATGVPVEQAYRVTCIASIENLDVPPAYPGVLSSDGLWLVRSEFDPRPPKIGEPSFKPSTIHIPVPPSLARLLIGQSGGLEVGKPAIRTSILHARPPTSRSESTWFSTLASRLMRHGTWGISLAQHVLNTSFGLDTAPIFYDRISAQDIAHAVAKVTHPWFKDPPRPAAKGMPKHAVGSQRVMDAALVKEHLSVRRAQWRDDSPVWERISHRAIHLLDGLALGIGLRINEGIGDIWLGHVSRRYRLICVGDKMVSLRQPHRLAALPDAWVCELEAYMDELAGAINAHPESSLAEQCRNALANTGPLFIFAKSPSDCRALALRDYVTSLPDWARSKTNFGRHFLNSCLAVRLPEALRVAQMGWSGTREGAFSELSPCSVMQACDRIRGATNTTLKEIGWRPLPPGNAAACNVKQLPISWMEAVATHTRNFNAGLRQRRRDSQYRLQEFAQAVLPAVNAFFHANDIALEATTDGLLLKSDFEGPVRVTRSMQQVLLLCMGGQKESSESAKAILHKWISAGRQAGITIGPLPQRVAHQLPVTSGPFLREVPSSLEHHDAVLDALTSASISMTTRVFVTVLMHGWLPDVKHTIALMSAGAKIYDLEEHDTLLIDPSNDSECVVSIPQGCFAMTGVAALALRAWHRGNLTGEISRQVIEVEIYPVLQHLMANDIRVDRILDELEALARARISLLAPGIVRDVAIGRVIPSFASIERVISLHESRAISVIPSEFHVTSHAVSSGVRKQRYGAAMEGYARIKDLLRHADEHWRPANDESLRGELVRALHAMVSAEGAATGPELIALYAAAYLTQGINKKHVRFSTVRDAVYAVGEVLLKHMPEQVDFQSREMWEATYLRAIHEHDAAGRHSLAIGLMRFHRVMQRDYGLPAVSFDDLLDLCDVRPLPHPIGFLTKSEEEACIAILGDWCMEAEQGEGWKNVIIARNDFAIASVAFASSLRDREITIPRWMDVHFRSDGSCVIKLRTHGAETLKTVNSRRTLKLVGKHRHVAMASLQLCLEQRGVLPGFNARSSVFSIEVNGSPARGTDDLTTRINRVLRHVTANQLASIDVTRKTWARNAFSDIPVSQFGNLWPTRDFLGAIGQANLATTQGHYLHDPVVFLSRTSTCTVGAKTNAWLLGMQPRCASRLLNKPLSWLNTPDPSLLDKGEARVINLPALWQGPKFDLTPSRVELALNLVGRGSSPVAAARAIGWPLRYQRAFGDAMQNVSDQGFKVGVLEEGESAVRPPRGAGRNDGLAECRAIQSCWPALEWMCERWLTVATLGIEGVPATSPIWDSKVPKESPVAKLPWEKTKVRGLEVYVLARAEKNKHSQWPQFRWLMLAAYVRKRMEAFLDSS